MAGRNGDTPSPQDFTSFAKPKSSVSAFSFKSEITSAYPKTQTPRQKLSGSKSVLSGALRKLQDERKGGVTSESKLSNFAKAGFKKNQPVIHEKFGVGIVQDIELRANGNTYLEVKFKTGTKKLDASFVKPS